MLVLVPNLQLQSQMLACFKEDYRYRDPFPLASCPSGFVCSKFDLVDEKDEPGDVIEIEKGVKPGGKGQHRHVYVINEQKFRVRKPKSRRSAGAACESKAERKDDAAAAAMDESESENESGTDEATVKGLLAQFNAKDFGCVIIDEGHHLPVRLRSVRDQQGCADRPHALPHRLPRTRRF